MRVNKKSPRELLKITLICSVVSSAAVLLVPVLGAAEKVRAVIVPLIFWGGLAAEQIFFRMFKGAVERSYYNEKGKNIKKQLPGAISFLKTQEGRNCDIVFAAALVLLIVFTAVQRNESVIQYILIFAVVLSFRYHSVFNGRYYDLLKNGKQQKKNKRKAEEENVSE